MGSDQLQEGMARMFSCARQIKVCWYYDYLPWRHDFGYQVIIAVHYGNVMRRAV